MKPYKNAKKTLCRNCMFSKIQSDLVNWKCTKGKNPELAIDHCAGYCCGKYDKTTGVRHKQSRCYICGKPTYSSGNDVALYCKEHKAYAREDDKVLSNMPNELLLCLIGGIFERARDDYINNTDGEKESARQFLKSTWAKTLAIADFDADELIELMDEEASDEH